MTVQHENGLLNTERFSFDEWGMARTIRSPEFPELFILPDLEELLDDMVALKNGVNF